MIDPVVAAPNKGVDELEVDKPPNVKAEDCVETGLLPKRLIYFFIYFHYEPPPL